MADVQAVEVRGVTRVFRGRPVLRAVSARFEAGTITFIEGPNGAGKSTLLAIMATGLEPSLGSVAYPPLGECRAAIRGELGWLAHESRAYKDLTARENVHLAARLRGVDPEAGFARVAETLGLGGFCDQGFGTLSRGQRQRVALARVLVHQPRVLLLDEPLTGLDSESTQRVASLLVAERDRGSVVVVVSHVEGFPERVQGRRIRLESGRLT
ncbi:MAG TPA: ABC transporter ATP-binding protein [Polyangiaceae bacterium]